VAHIGYKSALHGAVIAGMTLCIFMFVLIRNRPKTPILGQTEEQPSMNFQQLRYALRLIVTNKQMWLIGIIGCLLYLPSSVFLDLWGIPYLKAVYHLTAEQAVAISSYTFYGWIISGPIIGAFSDKIRRRRLPLIVSGLFAVLFLCIVFYT